MLYEATKISLRNLWSYKGRSFLTILGMVIGITAVIVIFSAGSGLRALLHQQIESYGSDTIEVEVKTPAVSKTSFANAASMAMGATITTLKIADMEAALKLPNVEDAYAGVMAQEQATYGDQRQRALILALGASAQNIDNTKLRAGRFFTDDEDRGLARVAVLGPEMKDNLFGDSDALGQYVKIDRVNFKVVGVLEARGATAFMNMDNSVYIPVRTAQKLVLGIDNIVFFMVKMKDGKLLDQTVADLNFLMRERHRTFTPEKEDFAVTSMAEARQTIDKVFNYLTFLLIALAAISLLVGGVGIMNVMFISVRERTYEIGLRKALGATNKNILWQFLIETALVAVVAGVIGIILGALFSFALYLGASAKGFSWPFSLPVNAILIATGFSVGFGFLFGILPARTAAKLDPIQALRFE